MKKRLDTAGDNPPAFYMEQPFYIKQPLCTVHLPGAGLSCGEEVKETSLPYSFIFRRSSNIPSKLSSAQATKLCT